MEDENRNFENTLTPKKIRKVRRKIYIVKGISKDKFANNRN